MDLEGINKSQLSGMQQKYNKHKKKLNAMNLKKIVISSSEELIAIALYDL